MQPTEAGSKCADNRKGQTWTGAITIFGFFFFTYLSSTLHRSFEPCVPVQVTADLDVRIVMDGLISTGVFDNKTWQLIEAEVRLELS